MLSYTPSPWQIQTDAAFFQPRQFAILAGTIEIASGIKTLADARLVRAAPELFEFARALCAVVLPDALDFDEQNDPSVVLALCDVMLPVIGKIRERTAASRE